MRQTGTTRGVTPRLWDPHHVTRHPAISVGCTRLRVLCVTWPAPQPSPSPASTHPLRIDECWPKWVRSVGSCCRILVPSQGPARSAKGAAGVARGNTAGDARHGIPRCPHEGTGGTHGTTDSSASRAAASPPLPARAHVSEMSLRVGAQCRHPSRRIHCGLPLLPLPPRRDHGADTSTSSQRDHRPHTGKQVWTAIDIVVGA
jgi:hypothetical protein